MEKEAGVRRRMHLITSFYVDDVKMILCSFEGANYAPHLFLFDDVKTILCRFVRTNYYQSGLSLHESTNDNL